MTTVTECLHLLKECGQEMTRTTRTAEQVHSQHMSQDFSDECENEASTEHDAYRFREDFHRADIRHGNGIFGYTVSEICDGNPELYKLMLEDPQTFGVTLANLFRTFATASCRKMAGQ